MSPRFRALRFGGACLLASCVAASAAEPAPRAASRPDGASLAAIADPSSTHVRLTGPGDFLASIPGEMRLRGADDPPGAVTIVNRLLGGRATLDLLFERFTRAPDAGGEAVALGGPDPCLRDCDIYAGDGGGNLWSIDLTTAVATLIGNTGAVMFDIAITRDRRLVGIDGGGGVYLIDACDASIAPVFFSGGGNGLGGDDGSDDLFSQGPPLARVSIDTSTTTTIGGSFGTDPPQWCGTSSGDLSLSSADGMLYSSLQCPECFGGDLLERIDPATGRAVAEVGCFRDASSGAALGSIYGLAHDCACFLWATRDGDPQLYAVDPNSALATPIAISGGFFGAYGLAAIPGTCATGNVPPSCNATADPPSCATTTLHANASDPDGDPLTYAWSSADCADATFAPSPSASDPDVDAGSACRTCTFTVDVADGQGGSCRSSVTVVFRDTTPPDVRAAALVACLWPPNHRMVDVGLTVEATDDCTPASAIVTSLAGVTSDEATATELGAGGPEHAPDASIDGMRVLLRAERSGLADGRVYRLTVTAADACGNVGTGVAEVRVPHDQHPKTPGQVPGNDPDGPCPAADDGDVHAAAGVD